MANVQFEEDTAIAPQRIFKDEVIPWMFALVMKTGLTKSKEQAKYILIAVIILCSSLTIVFAFKATRTSSAPPAPMTSLPQHGK